ncbi:MAG TPA: hypothetical protein DCE70_11725 [Acinetobacter sp.]|nr:hypothetical protein [Acinetobacter sp.]
MHECQEIWSANINQKEDRFLIYERDLVFILNKIKTQHYLILFFTFVISFLYFFLISRSDLLF